MRLIFLTILASQLLNLLEVFAEITSEDSSKLNPIKWEKLEIDESNLMKKILWKSYKVDESDFNSNHKEDSFRENKNNFLMKIKFNFH